MITILSLRIENYRLVVQQYDTRHYLLANFKEVSRILEITKFYDGTSPHVTVHVQDVSLLASEITVS